MVATSLRPNVYEWSKLSFASTLFLRPILDLLLKKIPEQLQPDLRLGLQEALVNAAKHGNKLDPGKTVVVRFGELEGRYWWIVSDEGCGFCVPDCSSEAAFSEDYPPKLEDFIPNDESECGRGLCILHQVFDWVEWNFNGTELRLSKRIETNRLSKPWYRLSRKSPLEVDSLTVIRDVALS